MINQEVKHKNTKVSARNASCGAASNCNNLKSKNEGKEHRVRRVISIYGNGSMECKEDIIGFAATPKVTSSKIYGKLENHKRDNDSIKGKSSVKRSKHA